IRTATSSGSAIRTLAATGTITVAGTFTPGGNVYTVTGSTLSFNGAGAQTLPAFNYHTLASSNTGDRTLAPSGTIGIAGAFTPGGSAYTVTGSTLSFNGSAAQSVSGFATFNNLAISNAAGVTLAASSTVNGSLTLTSGAL